MDQSLEKKKKRYRPTIESRNEIYYRSRFIILERSRTAWVGAPLRAKLPTIGIKHSWPRANVESSLIERCLFDDRVPRNPRSVNAAPRLERSEDSKAFFSRRVSIDLSIVNDPRFPAKLWLNYVRGSIRRDSEGNWKMIHRVRLSIPSGVIARVILNLTLRERSHARPVQAHSVSHDLVSLAHAR